MLIILALTTRIVRGKLQFSWIYWLFATMFDVWALRALVLAATR